MADEIRFSTKQKLLRHELGKRGELLVKIYDGAILAMSDPNNPDRFALAAHELRELMEKLGVSIGLPVKAFTDRHLSRITQLQQKFERIKSFPPCFLAIPNRNDCSEQLHLSLRNYIEESQSFFSWFSESHRRPEKETLALVRGMNINPSIVPSHLETVSVKTWRRLRRYFTDISHHSPSLVEQEFRANIVLLEDFLLSRFRAQAGSHLDSIDRLIAEGEASGVTEHLTTQLVQEMCKGNTEYGYFFSNAKSSIWIQSLLKHDCFQHPPESERDGDSISFPPWPESRYLARIASQAPELVADVISKIKVVTDNLSAHSDYVDAACAMPPELATSVARAEIEWLKSQDHIYFLGEKYGALMSHLAKGGQNKIAMQLASAILRLKPKPEGEEESFRGPEGILGDWEYEEFLAEYLPALGELEPFETVRLLSGLLSFAVSYDKTETAGEDCPDYSSIWCPAVEEEPAGSGRLEKKNVLIGALRKTLDLAAARPESDIGEVISPLKKHRASIFVRLILHVLRKSWSRVPETVCSYIMDRSLFDQADVLREYRLLMQDCFSLLCETEKTTLLGWIMNGPVPSAYEGSFQFWHNRAPSEDEIQRHCEEWQKDRLSWISPHLPEDLKILLDSLNQKHGKAKPAGYAPRSTAEWHGPTSPKTIEELRSLGLDELIQFLRSWQTTGEFMEPTPEGLSRDLTALATERPEVYSPAASCFIGLAPAYVRGLINGFTAAVKAGCSLHWAEVFKLCSWVLQQPKGIADKSEDPFQQDPDWSWTRRSIVNLIEQGLEDTTASIPLFYRDEVWALLQDLAEDPNPTPQEEAKQRDSLDPITLSINTVRGDAINAVVLYALWIWKSIGKDDIRKSETTERSFADFAPEIPTVLARHLHPDIDPSPAVHSVYGRWFPQLAFFDRQWTKDHLSLIFPESPEYLELRRAAWEGFVIINRPSNSTFQLLGEHYAYAASHVGEYSKGPTLITNADQALARQLMVLYWQGQIAIEDDSPLVRFFESAGDSLCATAFDFVGDRLERSDEVVPEDVIERLVALWEWRAAQIIGTPDSHREEIQSFASWFASGKLDPLWSLQRMKNIMASVKQIRDEHEAVEQLRELAPSFPAEVSEILALILKYRPERWRLKGEDDNIRHILQHLLQQNLPLRDAAEQMVHNLIEKGRLDFRDLLAQQRTETHQ